MNQNEAFDKCKLSTRLNQRMNSIDQIKNEQVQCKKILENL